MRFDDLTEEELIVIMRTEKNIDIVEYLLVKYKPLVLSKTRMLFLKGGEHDDLIQEGMLGLFKAIRDYDTESAASFKSFAGLCIERNIYQAIEKSQRLKNRPLNEAVSMEDADFSNITANVQQDPESIIIDEESAGVLRQKIAANLSSFENEVLDLFLEGKGYREIAKIKGKSPKSIDNAIQRIRTKIRQLIAN